MTHESHILKHADERTEHFRPNRKLDSLITQLRELLEPAQRSANRSFDRPRLPVIAVLGCPRSGTTFLTQLLAASGQFAYPSNLLSRFAYAPHIGAMIQTMLFDSDYDLRGELADLRSASDFSSDVGKTDGALGINEFFHFWRRFFPNHDPGYLTGEELENVDVRGLAQELASIEAVFQRPFMSKAMMLQYNVEFFAERIPELVFIHIRRDPRFVMQSIAGARRKYYGNDHIWWSVKPREYGFLKDMPPAAQVAGQVLFTDRAITQQLAKVGSTRKLVCDYEALCADPGGFFEQLGALLAALGVRLDRPALPTSFPCRNDTRMAAEEMAELEVWYDRLSAGSECTQ